MKLSPRLVGAVFGLLIGVIILWPHVGWRLVILAVLLVLGYLLGRYFEVSPEIKEKFRDFLAQLFR